MAIRIKSDTLIDVDVPFKVFAGPGAGKTYWLKTHILHVIKESKRLSVARKIACITYTNVGVDAIMSHLPYDASSFVEVCTIHSFLYTHVIKPFLHFEAQSFGIDVAKLRIEPPNTFLTIGFIKILLSVCEKLWIGPNSLLKNISACRWFSKSGEITKFRPHHSLKVRNNNGNEYHTPTILYDTYVTLRWKRGYISYDDIIYLSIKLINKYPEILNIIRAKFPYFFIDEFQDSSAPIVDFVKKIGNNGVIVGVIGDKEQTIYEFIGASVYLFENFTVPNMEEYAIYGNRRSTQSIIDLLNYIRPDFPQEPIQTEVGTKPKLLIGNKLQAYEMAINLCESKEVYSLAFPNIIANAMLYGEDNNEIDKSLLNDGFEDSDFERATKIRIILKATEYAYHNNFNEAFRQLELIEDDQRTNVGYLRKLLNHHNTFLNGSLYDFYQFIVNELHITFHNNELSNDKQFYLEHRYKDLALCVEVADSVALHKTIHKAKGEEYDNVMVILGENGIDVLVKPNLNKNTHRVYYVGMSRARKNLFINIERVDNNQLRILEGLPLDIIDL